MYLYDILFNEEIIYNIVKQTKCDVFFISFLKVHFCPFYGISWAIYHQYTLGKTHLKVGDFYLFVIEPLLFLQTEI